MSKGTSLKIFKVRIHSRFKKGEGRVILLRCKVTEKEFANGCKKILESMKKTSNLDYEDKEKEFIAKLCRKLDAKVLEVVRGRFLDIEL